MEQFTEEELALAKQVSMCAVVNSCGFRVRQMGKMHGIQGKGNNGDLSSLRIYNDHSWFRWSNHTGGSTVDFMTKIMGMEIVQAVKYLCNLQGGVRLPDADRKSIISEQKKDLPEKQAAFVLPSRNKDCKRLYGYLINCRKLSYQCVKFFQYTKNLMYESADHHNIVFLGKDSNGNTRFASMRGTGSNFKCDVIGNDKNYGFNLSDNKSNEVQVFEAAIDLMSYCDLYNEFKGNKLAM